MRFFTHGEGRTIMASDPIESGFLRSLLQPLLGWLERRRARRARPVVDRDGLAEFIRTRSAHVAQTSLYGYLRTRAGTRFPELFDNDEFVKSINIAKWHVWLDCVSDLAVHAGGLLQRHAGGQAQAENIMREIVDAVLVENGTPDEAGGEYPAHAERVRARIALTDWTALPGDDDVFSQSPSGLVYWAPIADELKQLDEEIVRNSVRFRWQEVRRELARLLNADAVLGLPIAAEGREARGQHGREP